MRSISAQAEKEPVTMTRFVDYAIVPLFLAASAVLTALVLEAGVHPGLAPTCAIAPLALAIFLLERARPESERHRAFDRPFVVEAAHFLFNYNVGYALASGAIALVDDGVRASGAPALWPVSWPLPLQVALMCVLAEMLSYWQHRLFHRVPALWRFHALHHSGERLNMVRAGRFHFADIGPGVFFVFLPLVLLGAPGHVVAWSAALTGVLGLLQHANVRVRTPAWADRLLCTPAVHRFHHSSEPRESDGNFGTIVMVFDVLFGTYLRPEAPAPETIGIPADPVRRGFWNEVIDPFRAR